MRRAALVGVAVAVVAAPAFAFARGWPWPLAVTMGAAVGALAFSALRVAARLRELRQPPDR